MELDKSEDNAVFEYYRSLIRDADHMKPRDIMRSIYHGKRSYAEEILKLDLDQLKQHVSHVFSVPSHNVKLTGSAKLGFSMKTGNEFVKGKSDLDLMIVDKNIFNLILNQISEQINDVESIIIKRYISRGYIRPDILPSSPLVNKWLNIAKSLTDCSRELFREVTITVYCSVEDYINKEVSILDRYLRIISTTESLAKGEGLEQILSSREHREKAMVLGFPAFIGDINDSVPSNSSPYVYSIESGLSAIIDLGDRNQLIETLKRYLLDIEKIVDIDALLLGGSIIRSDIAKPNDIDGVLFYRLKVSSPESCIAKIDAVTLSLKGVGIDIRIVPTDGPPWVLIKAVAFFATLYSVNRNGIGNLGTMLLVR